MDFIVHLFLSLHIYFFRIDDENDLLYLLARTGTGKWSVVPEVEIVQVKLDLLQFTMERPLEQ